MAIVTVGIDLAKNVFAVPGADASGAAVLVCPSVARTKLGTRSTAKLYKQRPGSLALKRECTTKLAQRADYFRARSDQSLVDLNQPRFFLEVESDMESGWVPERFTTRQGT